MGKTMFPAIERKKELNYRRGPTWGYCSQCNEYVGSFYINDRSGVTVAIEPRCRIIGLGDNRLYRITPNNICDRYDNSEHMKRYR